MFGTRIRPLRVRTGGPVVCCLYEGNFQYVAAASAIDASFYGLKIDGLESAGAGLSVETLARYHLQDLRAIQPQGPYCLLGCSSSSRLSRNPSPQELEIALRVYRADRARKYWTNLRTGRVDRLARDALAYVGKKLRPLIWRRSLPAIPRWAGARAR